MTNDRLNLENELRKYRNSIKAKKFLKFFQTAQGQYGEGDRFLGLTVPQQRSIAKKYNHLELKDIKILLDSVWHEDRFAALVILINQYQKEKSSRSVIYRFYLKNIHRVNNWDLVDISAPKIVGHWLLTHNRQILYRLVKSKKWWVRRISIISTFPLIKEGKFDDTLDLAIHLLDDQHDLLHKATGWMLREVGKQNQSVLERFLSKYRTVMPRTMLRYAIEKLEPKKRKHYLSIKQ